MFRSPPSPWLRWLAGGGLVLALHGLLLQALLAPPHGVPAEPVAATARQSLLPVPPPVPAQQLDRAGEAEAAARPAPPPRHRARPVPDSEPPPTAGAATAAGWLPPSPAQWRYRLRQDGREGQALLSWQLDEQGGYRLTLQRQLEGRPLPGWRSQGRLVAGGLLPERFALLAGERERQATNFRHAEGLISHSAHGQSYALAPGAQDRLSWWLHLGLRLQLGPADPAELAPLLLPVAGARGEVQRWVFVNLGLVNVQPADGGPAQPAWQLLRHGLGPYDSQIEVWLATGTAGPPLRLRHSWQGLERMELLRLAAMPP